MSSDVVEEAESVDLELPVVQESRLPAFMHQRDGHLTRELLLEPGGFGLGHVPAKTKPDATTKMTCGYCSTGCGLNIHLKDGEAVSLTPATEYPVNLGMACPKGWEALTVLDSPDRATLPLLKDAGGQAAPVRQRAAPACRRRGG